MEQFFGGKPFSVALRLVIISIVAGVALNAAGYDPRQLLDAIPRLIQAVYDLGFGWVHRILQYFLLGAVVVIPAWLLIRLVKFLVGDSKGGPGTSPRP
jgi:hypothetical protein